MGIKIDNIFGFASPAVEFGKGIKELCRGVINGIKTASGEIDDEFESDYSEDSPENIVDYYDLYRRAESKITQYRDCWDRPQEQDIRWRIDASNAILPLSIHGAEDKDIKEVSDKLKIMLEEAGSYVKNTREWQSTLQRIEELRDPDNVVLGTKIQDIDEAFSLLEVFRGDYLGEDGYWYFKTRVYNALFAALTRWPDELNALTNKQLADYYTDAEKSAAKNVELWDDEDVEGKEIPKAQYDRILEQIEEVKGLRSRKTDSTTSAVTAQSLTYDNNEQEYLEEVKACLQDDGNITDRERRLLDRLRKSLGISEGRASELEASLNLEDEEKDYLEEFKAYILDGEISDRERKILDRVRKSLGISEERAKELEGSIK